MDVVTEKMMEIDNKIAEFKTKNGVMPKYLILGIEARQAIKLSISPPQFWILNTWSSADVIKLEEAVIVK